MMKVPLTIILFIIVYSCNLLPKPASEGESTQDENEFYRVVNQHFSSIDSASKIDPDLSEAENIKLQQTIHKYRNLIISLDNSINFRFWHLARSSDSQLCLVSWDTKMGGTMIDYATMAIFKTSEGETHSKLLLDTTEKNFDNTRMIYNDLYTIATDNDRLYIAHGFGRGSTILPWQELRAFRILDSLLINPKVFPEHKFTLFVEFDIQKLNTDTIPKISIMNAGKEILVPVTNDDETFSGKYEKLIFNDGGFKTQ